MISSVFVLLLLALWTPRQQSRQPEARSRDRAQHWLSPAWVRTISWEGRWSLWRIPKGGWGLVVRLVVWGVPTEADVDWYLRGWNDEALLVVCMYLE